MLTCLYALMAQSAFVLNDLSYSSLLVPHYRLIFASLKALPTMDTAEITLLPARDIPQRAVVTEEDDPCRGRNQLNQVLWTLSNTESTPGALALIYDGYFLLGVY